MTMLISDKRFDKEYERVLGLEGNYSNDPDDPGGETKYGISKKAHPELDIKNLTLDDAKKIYYLEYWAKINLGAVANDSIAGEMFDTGVNCGVSEAVVIAQKAINFLGGSVDVDGKMGPMTLNAINTWGTKDPEAFFKVLNGFQFIHYVEIIEKKSVLKKYARGWMKRIQQYRV